MTETFTKETQTKMLERVRSLLAKAESTDSEHEAELCTLRAAEIMARYNIDKAMAEHRDHKDTKPVQQDFHIVAPYATAKVSLLAAVGSGFRCTVYYSGAGTYTTAHVYGFQDDIDAVMLLFTSLLLQAANAAKRVHATTEGRYRTVNRTKSARRAYLLGFARSIRERLEVAQQAATQDSESGTAASKELVLVSREAAVRAILPKARKVSQVSRNREAFDQGRADGNRANLHDRAEVAPRGRAITR